MRGNSPACLCRLKQMHVTATWTLPSMPCATLTPKPQHYCQVARQPAYIRVVNLHSSTPIIVSRVECQLERGVLAGISDDEFTAEMEEYCEASFSAGNSGAFVRSLPALESGLRLILALGCI